MTGPTARWKVALPVAVVMLLGLAPFALSETRAGEYALRLTVIGLMYAASAVAWDLVGGMAGQVSFGHATFFGLGAYATGILVRNGWPVILTLPVGALTASLYAMLWGWPCLRLRGPFFAIATIGVGEATRLIALNLESLTGGATGLTLPVSGGASFAPYYLALGLTTAALVISASIRRSRLGLGLECIREDLDAAESIGIASGRLQVQALMLSAAIVGVAGGIHARVLFYVDPGDVFSFNRSIGLILMAIIGGLNTLWGPAIGALLFLALEQFLGASFPQIHLGIYGMLLVLIMAFEPKGLLALVSRARSVIRL